MPIVLESPASAVIVFVSWMLQLCSEKRGVTGLLMKELHAKNLSFE